MPVFKIKFQSDRGIVIFYVTDQSGQSAANRATDELSPMRLSGYVGRRDITEITALTGVNDTIDMPRIIDTIKLIG